MSGESCRSPWFLDSIFVWILAGQSVFGGLRRAVRGRLPHTFGSGNAVVGLVGRVIVALGDGRGVGWGAVAAGGFRLFRFT